MNDSTPSEDQIVRVAPHARLSRSGMIALFALMVAIGLGVYSLFPESIGGKPLPVDVAIQESPVETVTGNLAVMTKVVSVANQFDGPIGNLTIELNGNYIMMHASPLASGERLELPLGIFTAKRSSRRFDPQTQVVNEIVVRGQMPDKSRGISKFEFDH